MIIGGGIGGLTAALSLHAAGYEVDVFESVPELRPLGVGINLLPHAVRELDELGLQDELLAQGVHTSQLSYHTKRGENIWAEPRGIDAGYRWPQISIHRGMLQMTLLRATVARIGADHIHLDHHVHSFSETDGEVQATFVSRSSGATLGTRRAQLLIAADGIHSVIRSQLYPDEGGPKWNGAIMWRGVAQGQPFLDGRSMIMAGHANQKFVAYPLAVPGQDGTQPLNFVAELRFEESELSDREDWNKPGNIDDVLPAFKTWDFGWLDAPGLISAAPEMFVYPMIDRDPLPRWSFGPVTLLGDAAHPMYPIGSNGASQAILDARVLAGCLLSKPDDPIAALETYDEVRRPATAKIVLSNRGQGPEEAMQLVEDRAPDGFGRLDEVISEDELRVIADKYKAIAGFAITELNSRPSLASPNY